jgi:hypothetical protein
VTLRYPLLVKQGEDFEKLLPVLDGNKQPANVDGWQAIGQIREGPGTPLLHTLTLTPTGTSVRVTISGTASAAWPFRLAKYDIKLTSPGAIATRLIEGAVVVYPQISVA